MASGGGDVVVQPRGYPIEIFSSEVNSKYRCGLCRRILKNPSQSFCGHRFCKDCIVYHVRNKADITCSLCVDEDAVNEFSILKEEETFPDNAIRRELYAMSVRCSFDGCSWTGTFKEYEVHYEVCEFLLVPCERCGVEFPKNKLEEHQTTCHEAVGGLCPLGCGQQVESESYKNHVIENIVRHMDVIHEKIRMLERNIGSRLSEAKIAEIETNLKRVEDALRGLQTTGSRSTATSGGAGRSSSTTQEVQSILDATGEKMVIYEGVITVLNREIEKLTLQMEAMERQRRLERDLLDTMDRKVKSLERMLAMKDATIAEIDLRITSLELTSYDGTLLWRITDVTRKRQEAVNGRTTSIYSPAFYTHKTGYKMCARVYLNGDGMGKGTHISLFFVIMRGQYDPLLKWPFRQKVTLMFLDQNNREHVIDAFRPDPTSSSFKKPTTEMNIASGCPLLMPLTSLDTPTHAYVKDNTAFIKIIVSLDDLPP